jgi:hypothetical protein
MIIKKKMHWQRQFEDISLEFSNLKNQVSTSNRERDRERDLIESLRQVFILLFLSMKMLNIILFRIIKLCMAE